mmetsp:Transcript_39852/g.56170  ORF Transcript_39852/g.56170 Transcript_39852/m.56170 type:complete len:303 (+) Transcript_39852:133-1041(+)
MFKGRDDGLPMAQYGSYQGSADGSGRSIKMDAPIVKAWKTSSRYTKGTYYILIFFIFLTFMGYRTLRHGNASIWLTCHAQYCLLQITPPGRVGTTSFEFSRHQLVRGRAIKVNKYGEFIGIDNSPTLPLYTSKGKKNKKSTGSKGPDTNGHYDSYFVVLKDGSSDNPHDEYETDLSAIDHFVTRDPEFPDHANLQMRKFNLGQTRRRTKTLVSKIDSYQKNRRHQLTLKENATLSWQGILALILGLFGGMLTCIIGQFYDEPSSIGGPGARQRRQHNAGKRRQPPKKMSKRDAANGGFKKAY